MYTMSDAIIRIDTLLPDLSPLALLSLTDWSNGARNKCLTCNSAIPTPLSGHKIKLAEVIYGQYVYCTLLIQARLIITSYR